MVLFERIRGNPPAGNAVVFTRAWLLTEICNYALESATIASLSCPGPAFWQQTDSAGTGSVAAAVLAVGQVEAAAVLAEPEEDQWLRTCAERL